MAITKTDGTTAYTRGGTLTYTIVVTNNGPSDVVNAVVTDNKPSRISRWTWACAGATAGASGCDGVTDSTANFTDTVDLPAGATITYTVTALVTTSATGNLVNTACVAPPAGTTDPTTSNDCATDTDQPLIITIAKTAAAPVQTAPNSFQMVYTLTVSNTGAVAGTYNLDDEFQFGTGVTVVGTPTVTYAAASTDTLGTTINAAFAGAAPNTRLVTNEALGVGLADVFTVTVNISVDAATATSTSLNCTLNTGETGTGARNTATLSGNAAGTATACQALPGFTLGNRVWHDLDNDGFLGIEDGPSPGMDGVVINLYAETSGDNVPDGAVLQTTTTAGGGYYYFHNLVPGRYVVEVAASNFVLGARLHGFVSNANDGGDPDADISDDDDNGRGMTPSATNGIRSFAVNLGSPSNEPTADNDPDTNPLAGEAPNNRSNRTVDFGFARTYTLGNRVWKDVWKDMDNSGTINAADGAAPGIDGVVVRLLSSPALTQATDAGGALVPDQTTAGGGYYSFSNVPAGDYVVQLPASNFNGNGVLVGCVTSTGAPGVSGGGTGPNEPAPDPDNNVDGDDNGTAVAGGAVQSLPITLGEGTGAAEPINDNDPATNPQPGEGPNNQSNRTLDFGFTSLMTVGNLVWKDLDADGLRDTVAPNEPGIANVKVVLYADTNNNGTFNLPADQMAAMTNTNSSGAYSFANVLPGNYFVVVDGGNFAAGGALLGCVSTPGNVTGNSDQDNNDHGVDNPTPA